MWAGGLGVGRRAGCGQEEWVWAGHRGRTHTPAPAGEEQLQEEGGGEASRVTTQRSDGDLSKSFLKAYAPEAPGEVSG